MTVTQIAETAAAEVESAITLQVDNCRARTSYLAHFATEEQALAFIDERSSTHAFTEVEAFPLDYDAAPRLYDALYPTCEHGLSADLCAGYGHYPMDHPAYM